MYHLGSLPNQLHVTYANRMPHRATVIVLPRRVLLYYGPKNSLRSGLLAVCQQRHLYVGITSTVFHPTLDVENASGSLRKAAVTMFLARVILASFSPLFI